MATEEAIEARKSIETFITVIAALVLISCAARDVLFPEHNFDTLTFNTHAGHSWDYNIWRTLGLADSFRQGHSGQWLADFSHGWGYPLFYYTGPLAYISSAILFLFGMDINAALNVAWLLAFFGAGLAMFWAMRRILGPWPAVLAATCYSFAPYHLVDVFVRTNLSEFTSFCFLPIISYALWLSRTKPASATLIGAIAVAAISLNHMVSVMLAGIGFGVFAPCFILFVNRAERANVVRGAIGIIGLGLGLSAFFWLPALGDLDAVKGSSTLTAGYNSYLMHFVYPEQLISFAWEYGQSEPGPVDYMSFSFGPSIAVMCVASLLCLIAYALPSFVPRSKVNVEDNERHARLAFILAAFYACLFTAFMTTALSEPLWAILPKVDIVQFPWRFLLPASFFISICAGALPRLLSLFTPLAKRYNWVVSIFLCFVILVMHWDYARAGVYDAVPKERLRPDVVQQLGIYTTNHGDFLPKQVLDAPGGRSHLPQIYTSNTLGLGVAEVLSHVLKNGSAHADLPVGASGMLILRQHWHPGWKAYVDGRQQQVQPFKNHPLAPVSVFLSEPNPFSAYFRFGLTPSGIAGSLVSVVFLLIAVYLLTRLRSYQLAFTAGIAALWLLGGVVYDQAYAWFLPGGIEDRLDRITHFVDAKTVSTRKPERYPWDSPGTIPISEQGLIVDLGRRIYNPSIEISLDSNDYHTLAFLDESKLIGQLDLVPTFSGGLHTSSIDIPENIIAQGYSLIAVLPRTGDGRYSIGHLLATNQRRLTEEDWAKISFRDSPFANLRKVSLASVGEPKAAGSAWNGPGTTIIKPDGLVIDLESVHNHQQLVVSIDNNDYYRFTFYKGEDYVGFVEFQPPIRRTGGLVIQAAELPAKIHQQGYDKIVVSPRLGDKRYSIGHLVLQ